MTRNWTPTAMMAAATYAVADARARLAVVVLTVVTVITKQVHARA